MKFGIELTYIRWKGYPKTDQHKVGRPIITRDYWNNRKIVSYSELSFAVSKYINAFDVEMDHDALEIASPKFDTLEKFGAWYDRLDANVIRPFGLKSHYSTSKVIEGTGGGHVHCELPKKITHQNFFHKFLDVNQKLYFLRWMFGDLCDEDLTPYHKCQPLDFFGKTPSSIITITDHGTLEHRYFDAPKDKSEAIDFINFARHLSQGIYDNNRFDIFQFKDRKDVDYMRRRWEALLRLLMLDINQYEKYWQRYLFWRENYPLK